MSNRERQDFRSETGWVPAGWIPSASAEEEAVRQGLLHEPVPSSLRPPEESGEVRLTLSHEDIMAVVTEGRWRTATRRGPSHGSERRFGSRAEEAMNDIHAAGAELAVARYLDRVWTGYHHRGTCDVDGRVEVRFRRSGAKLDLWLNEEDARGTPRHWVLVSGIPPEYSIVGWITAPGDLDPAWYGYRISRAEYSWIIPVRALRPIRELKQEGP